MSENATPRETLPQEQRTDGFAVAACVLAVVVMIFPLEADMLFVLMEHHAADGALFAAACFLVVFTPFLLSVRRRRKQPGRWANRTSLIVAGIILVLNLTAVSCIFVNSYMKLKP